MTIRVMVVLEARYVTGAVKPVFEFAREAARREAFPRIELSVLTFMRNETANSFTRAVEAEGLPLDVIPEKRAFDPSILRQLREIVARRKPDIIWTHSVKSHFLIRLAGLHREAKWIAFHHGYTSTALRTRLYNQLDRWSHKGADRLVTVCDAFAQMLEKRGISRSKLRVQHSPIRPVPPHPSFSAAAARLELGLDPESKIVLSVGRLSGEKNQALLLRAVARVHELAPTLPLRLLIVGDGPERASLNILAATLGVSSIVTFAGHQNRPESFYRASDIFVLSSRTEGSPNVLLEAMDAGLAIVATTVGGVPEMVGHEQSALLVPSEDQEAMARAILRLLEDPNLRSRLVAAGKQVLSKHTPEEYFRSVSRIFEEILNPSR